MYPFSLPCNKYTVYMKYIVYTTYIQFILLVSIGTVVCFLFVCLFYMQPLIASGSIIEAHGTDVSVGIRLLSGETLLQEKSSTGYNWDSNPGPC